MVEDIEGTWPIVNLHRDFPPEYLALSVNDENCRRVISGGIRHTVCLGDCPVRISQDGVRHTASRQALAHVRLGALRSGAILPRKCQHLRVFPHKFLVPLSKLTELRKTGPSGVAVVEDQHHGAMILQLLIESHLLVVGIAERKRGGAFTHKRRRYLSHSRGGRRGGTDWLRG